MATAPPDRFGKTLQACATSVDPLFRRIFCFEGRLVGTWSLLVSSPRHVPEEISKMCFLRELEECRA
eukprot:3289408-Pyramimonas_sp.AAC.1